MNENVINNSKNNNELRYEMENGVRIYNGQTKGIFSKKPYGKGSMKTIKEINNSKEAYEFTAYFYNDIILFNNRKIKKDNSSYNKTNIILDKNSYSRLKTYTLFKKNTLYTTNISKESSLLNNKSEHIKINFVDHGSPFRTLANDIKPSDFDIFKKNQNMKSFYISSHSCHGGFCSPHTNYNLFDVVKEQVKNNLGCIGFLSLVNSDCFITEYFTSDHHRNEGLKRVAEKLQHNTDLTDPSFKNSNFKYYCIINEKENGQIVQNIYRIPPELCYWREELIDNEKFNDVFQQLKNHTMQGFDINNYIVNHPKNKVNKKFPLIVKPSCDIKKCQIITNMITNQINDNKYCSYKYFNNEIVELQNEQPQNQQPNINQIQNNSFDH